MANRLRAPSSCRGASHRRQTTLRELLGVPITFANRRNATQDQFDVCVESQAFKVNNGQELCTARLKTEPFMEWLAANASQDDSTIYYGFDVNEQDRIQRRAGIMGAQGCCKSSWRPTSAKCKTDSSLLQPISAMRRSLMAIACSIGTKCMLPR